MWISQVGCQAIADGKPIPEGKDYQQGSKYLFQTEREAVFSRDHYTCQVCGKSVKDGVILHTHHIGYWKGYRSNRISNLLTVCEHCHTAKNHKPGGALWGLEPQSTNLAAATYMSIVRWAIYRELVLKYQEIDIHIQYGAKTSVTRKSLHLAKTHANDAYCIGSLHPRHRTTELVYQKKRRNNRILAKFYDAKYIDVRDGAKKSGAVLSCGRTNRRESRRSDKNQRIYRGNKCSSGHTSVRKNHYVYQPGDTIVFHSQRFVVNGSHCKGARVILGTGKSVKATDLTCIKKEGGWRFLPAQA